MPFGERQTTCGFGIFLTAVGPPAISHAVGSSCPPFYIWLYSVKRGYNLSHISLLCVIRNRLITSEHQTLNENSTNSEHKNSSRSSTLTVDVVVSERLLTIVLVCENLVSDWFSVLGLETW